MWRGRSCFLFIGSCGGDEPTTRPRAGGEDGVWTRDAQGGGVGREVFGKMAMEATATGETRRVTMAGAANLRATATATTKTAVQSAEMFLAQSQFGVRQQPQLDNRRSQAIK